MTSVGNLEKLLNKIIQKLKRKGSTKGRLGANLADQCKLRINVIFQIFTVFKFNKKI